MRQSQAIKPGDWPPGLSWWPSASANVPLISRDTPPPALPHPTPTEAVRWARRPEGRTSSPVVGGISAWGGSVACSRSRISRRGQAAGWEDLPSQHPMPHFQPGNCVYERLVQGQVGKTCRLSGNQWRSQICSWCCLLSSQGAPGIFLF